MLRFIAMNYFALRIQQNKKVNLDSTSGKINDNNKKNHIYY